MGERLGLASNHDADRQGPSPSHPQQLSRPPFFSFFFMLPPSLFLYLYFSKIHCINTSKDWHSLLFSMSGPWLMLFLLPEMSFCDPPPPSTPLLSFSVYLVNTCPSPKTCFRCLFLQEAFLEGPALTSPQSEPPLCFGSYVGTLVQLGCSYLFIYLSPPPV